MRVHVVFTGGTIGSSANGASTDLVTDADRQLLSFAPPGTDIAFTHSSPFRILSEDATLANWSTLVGHIAGLDLERIDAIVVAHGSDTLAWSAKALAYGLAGIPVPLVLTGSDKPLSAPHSNGPQNFRDALVFAISERLPGVYVAWKNPAEPTTIHLGTRLLPCDIHDDNFRSALGLCFGTVADGTFRRNAVQGNPSRSHLAKSPDAESWIQSRSRAKSAFQFSPDVLVLPAMPGMPLSGIFEARPWRAVVQMAYHSGTACSLDGPDSLVELARICRERDVPMIVGPTRPSASPYASVARLEGVDCRFAPSMAESALVAKMRWLVGTGQDLSLLGRPVAFDLLGP